MPTEAEWEYACRAGTETRFYWEDDLDYKQINEYAWYRDNSNGQTHEVDQKQPNAWGLFDMCGNVWEWCEDDWHENYMSYNGAHAPMDGSAWVDTPRDNERARVIRGGCWRNLPFQLRSTFRMACASRKTSDETGLRIVLERT